MKTPPLTLQQREENDRFASFDEFNGEDIDCLARACAEHGVDLKDLRTLLSYPLATASVLRAMRDQRPLAHLGTYVSDKSRYRAVVDELMRRDYLLRGLYAGIQNDAAARIERARELAAKLFIAEKRLRKLDIERQKTHRETLPLALLALTSFQDTFDVYETALRDRFAFPRATRPPSEAGLVQNHSFERLSPVPFVPRERRLVRIGLLEVEAVRPGSAELVRQLPRGAQLASYEILAAIQRYPRLLDWMRQHPAGGIKQEVTAFGLWLLSMRTGDKATDRAVRLGVTFDELNRARIGSFKLVRYTEHHPAVDFVPYIIPVSAMVIDLDD